MSSDDEKTEVQWEALGAMLAGLGVSNDTSKAVLPELTIEAVAEVLKTGKDVIVMCGAGISTSAGIPDFRSPDTGLYATMSADDELPYPEAVFEISFFKKNPRPFFKLRKSFLTGDYKPTPTHCFLKLLHDKGVLRRVFTQNIDALEIKAGLPDDKVVEAHGSIKDGKCMKCGTKYPSSYSTSFMDKDEIPTCEILEVIPAPDGTEAAETITKCEGVIKPGIVMFGEALPERFFMQAQDDYKRCDLLIVIGTSLAVAPFNGFVSRVPKDCPRLLINRDKVGHRGGFMGGPNFAFDRPGNTRDVFWAGDCDTGTAKLAELVGWKEDLKRIINHVSVVDPRAEKF